MNFVSVSSALSLPESGIAAAIAADTVVGLSYLFVLLSLSRSKWLLRWYPLPEGENIQDEPSAPLNTTQEPHWTIRMWRICLALMVSFGIFIVSREIAEFIKAEQFTLLIVTAFALLIAHLIPSRMANTKGIFQVGTLLMDGFFSLSR